MITEATLDNLIDNYGLFVIAAFLVLILIFEIGSIFHERVHDILAKRFPKVFKMADNGGVAAGSPVDPTKQLKDALKASNRAANAAKANQRMFLFLLTFFATVAFLIVRINTRITSTQQYIADTTNSLSDLRNEFQAELAKTSQAYEVMGRKVLAMGEMEVFNTPSELFNELIALRDDPSTTSIYTTAIRMEGFIDIAESSREGKIVYKGDDEQSIALATKWFEEMDEWLTQGGAFRSAGRIVATPTRDTNGQATWDNADIDQWTRYFHKQMADAGAGENWTTWQYHWDGKSPIINVTIFNNTDAVFSITRPKDAVNEIRGFRVRDRDLVTIIKATYFDAYTRNPSTKQYFASQEIPK